MYEYKVIEKENKVELEIDINQLAKEGYRLHSITSVVIPGTHVYQEFVSFVAALERQVPDK